MFGQSGIGVPDDNRTYALNSADLVVPNMEAWRLMWDFTALHQLYEELPGDTPLAQRALHTANEIMNVFQVGDLATVPKARKVAEEVLGKDWEKEITWDSSWAERQKGSLWGVGHW